MNQDSNIAILGYGVEGQAMMNYLIAHNYKKITICDRRDTLENLPLDINSILGSDYLETLDQFDVIFRSPGISCLTSQLVKYQDKITTPTNYFLKNCLGKIIGVTGTKGKGTTSTLIYEILKQAGKKVFLGGNIGEPPINFLDLVESDTLVVLELSSFQLQDLKYSPHIAVILNVTSDHLDYHTDQLEYLQAKQMIVRNQTDQDMVVVNSDYELSQKFSKLTDAQILNISTQHEISQGSFVVDNRIFTNISGVEEYIVSGDEVGLLGVHNLENILPAVTVTRKLGVPIDVIKTVLKGFTGLPHRLELVNKINNLKFYNDSFSTGPETAIAALNSFPEGTVIILLGGSEKYSDFSNLGQEIVSKLAIPICFGLTKEKIHVAIKTVNENYPVYMCEDLNEAFQKALSVSESGEVILLSPACASFDQFNNYKERGQFFRDLVSGYSDIESGNID